MCEASTLIEEAGETVQNLGLRLFGAAAVNDRYRIRPLLYYPITRHLESRRIAY